MAKGIDLFCNQIATVFGLGRSPLAPGTLGSLFGLVLVALWFPQNPAFQAIWVVVATVLGLLTSRRIMSLSGKKDPSEVVIDEVAGVFLTFFWLSSDHLWVLVSGFLLFRLFDITKPWLVGKADKLEGPLGIMLDDLIAGLFANLILQLVLRLI